MIDYYFGFPRCGKTTFAVSMAFKTQNAIEKGRSKYKYVLTNFKTNIPGVIYFPFDKIGDYCLDHCFVLIDEASLFCDSRDFKIVSKKFLNYMMLHGHDECDFAFFSQVYNGLDKKVRNITVHVYWVYRPFFSGLFCSSAVMIPHKLLFPEEVGDIEMGYVKPPLMNRIFARRVFRPKYYGMFDTHENVLGLPDIREYIQDSQTLKQK